MPDETGLVFSCTGSTPTGWSCAADGEARWTWRSYLATDMRARKTIDQRAACCRPVVREALLASGYACHLDLDDGWLHGDLPDLRHDYSMEAHGPRPFSLRAQR